MRLLITGALGATPEDIAAFEALGYSVTVHSDEASAVEHPEAYGAVICNGLFLYNDIEKFKNLRLIQLTSAGYDRAPVDYAAAHGIAVKNAEGVYAVPMAEWTVMRILELYKNAENLFSQKTWAKDRTWRELYGKTACLIGFGAYGAETAKRLHAFGVRVLAVNRSAKHSPYVEAFYPLEELNTALGEADIVILGIALTESTRHLINGERIKAMKDGAVLINGARGALIDEAALCDALGGKLSGAALDVFETEPLPEHSPLWSAKGLLISPHNSFVGEHNHRRLMDVCRKNLKLNQLLTSESVTNVDKGK